MPQAEKLKIGIIGAGKMGGYHLDKFLSLETCEVLGIYDADKERANALGEKHGVKAFQQIEELIFDSDAVVIASSSNTHYTLVKQALGAGLHVLVEKPLALNSKEARELAELAEEKKLVLQVGFVERFRLKEMSLFVELKQIQQIECERVTERVGREPNVDVITDLMIHDLDLILSLNLGNIKNVRAKGTAVLHETIDIAVADLEFDSGASVHLIANRLGPVANRRIRFLMDGSYCKMDLNRSTVTDVRKSGSKTYELAKEKDFLFEQAKDFCDAVLGKKLPLVSARQGAMSIELVEIILNSLHTTTLEQIRHELAPKEN